MVTEKFEKVSYIERHRLGLKLRPILVGELHLIKKLKFPAYIFQEGSFNQILEEGSTPKKEQIDNLLQNSFRDVYVHGEDLENVKENLRLALIKITRSLSVGDPLENGMRDIKLLTLNLGSLYKNPHDDNVLTLQFQSGLNLCNFLLENKRYQSTFYHNLANDKFHFTLMQPLLSSILLLSFLQSIRLFQQKEIEGLFLTSYLKDVGISMIPESKYDLTSLSTQDMDMFSSHSKLSHSLLYGRVPLSKNYLNIIQNHHFLNDKIKNIIKKETHNKNPDMIYGLESTLVSVFDIIVAMISDRPYRKGKSLYKSLEVARMLMSDEYPQEFKALVLFFKPFYKF